MNTSPPGWRPPPTPEQTHAAVAYTLRRAAARTPRRPVTWPRELPEELSAAADAAAWFARIGDTTDLDRADALGLEGPWNRGRR